MRTMHLVHKRPSHGLTLVEVLAVVAILSTLLAMLLPAAQAARETARQQSCQNNLRQIALAMNAFESARMTFPVGCLECDYRLPAPRRRLSWMAYLLPYCEYTALADQLDWGQSYKSAANAGSGRAVLPLLLCPSTVRTERVGFTTGDVNHNGRWDPGDDLAYTDYAGLFGVGYPTPQILPEHRGVMIYEQPTSARQITDGLSKTAIVGECTGRDSQQQSEWIHGNNIFDQQFDRGINETQDNELWSDHRSGAQVAFCDAHVEFLSEQIEQRVLLSHITRQAND